MQGYVYGVGRSPPDMDKNTLLLGRICKVLYVWADVEENTLLLTLTDRKWKAEVAKIWGSLFLFCFSLRQSLVM